MGARLERAKRAFYVARVARRGRLLRVLRELGVVGGRPATREGAREFREALEELGTTYIKLGQLLSSRPDLLPDVYIEELGKLVDEVPPVPFEQIQRVIAEELPADTFVRIDSEPLATASIAQIHTALLTSGREVIVKVRRPGIERQVQLDLDLLRSTAGLLEERSGRAQLLQARALADELEGHLRGLLGRLDEDTRRTLALLLLAVAQNRADDVADLILGLSRTNLDADEPGFIHELRRKLPRYHWRPLEEIHAGEALADLQRISFDYGIALPTTFALVGKTLAQADSIARVLYPELDPIALLEEDALEVMLGEGEPRLEPNQFLAWLYTQLEPLARMPRRVGHLAAKLEAGTFKVGVAPTDLADLEHAMRSVANRVGGGGVVGPPV